MKILIINGPNLNLLGSREKNIYGSMTLNDINTMIMERFRDSSIVFEFFQSNSEGYIVSKIQQAISNYDGIVINPGAYSHYSIAILDAIRSISIPVIEVHISNIFSREEYRKKSVTAEGCVGFICGFGCYGYVLAVEALLSMGVMGKSV
ncbi:3-dehydroquinate dehydratase [Clostridium tepidiprofundi DSM 19306]|uniref:3-dehydroquinate dehydratase n=1 Tax=Clostridium tepidiprofundi DSM 19306 TaxID=1121338 RepID=A0A151B7A1_9CLOT|nr:type II 3-dehydroquinate dehydratase [Clostridium tepidiprofundi]KYH35683.1 3-dehydroquinate dehydratase [Clostridium tepidiprofundi DSM 19306]